MTKRKKKRAKRVTPTELEILREKLRREDVWAHKPFKHKQWWLMRLQQRAPSNDPHYVEIAWKRVNIHLKIMRFNSEEIALRHAVIHPEDYIWRR